MKLFNLWLGMRETAAVVVRTALRWDEESQGPYTGPVTDREIKFFRFMADQPNTEKLWKKATLGGNEWIMWSIGFNVPGGTAALLKNEIDALIAKYSTQVAVAGAWVIEFDKPFSRQIGTQYLVESVEQFGNDPQFNQPDVPNPDLQPDPDLPDYDPNETIPDPTWVAPDPWPQISFGFADEITGTTGAPTYPINKTQLLKFMPDVGGFPATELSDLNLGMGWPFRDFP